MAFARPAQWFLLVRCTSLIDKGENTDTPFMCFSVALEFIVSGTCITQVNQFSLVDSNVLNMVSQTHKVFSTQEMVTEDHCQSTSETALAGTLPGQHLHLRQCCAGPAWPLPTPFSEIIPLGKPSQGVRSMSYWGIPQAPAVPGCDCVCGLPQCWQRPLCPGQWQVLGLLHWENTWKQPSQFAVRQSRGASCPMGIDREGHARKEEVAKH